MAANSPPMGDGEGKPTYAFDLDGGLGCEDRAIRAKDPGAETNIELTRHSMTFWSK